jgi:hypothetical protein
MPVYERFHCYDNIVRFSYWCMRLGSLLHCAVLMIHEFRELILGRLMTHIPDYMRWSVCVLCMPKTLSLEELRKTTNTSYDELPCSVSENHEIVRSMD